MKILKYIGLGLLILIVVLVAVAYLLPREVGAERSVEIEAPPEVVFDYANSFERFNEWSPWYKRDPNATYTYSGPKTGKGASMSWDGNDEVGKGTQTIIESVPGKLVRTSLDFGEQGGGEALITIEKTDSGSRVTWSFKADMGMNPMARWFGLFMDSLIGKDYEEGLQNLKKLVENREAP